MTEGFQWSPNDHRRCVATEFRLIGGIRTIVTCSLTRRHEGEHVHGRKAFGVRSIP